MMKWKEKSKISKRLQQLIEGFSLFIKQCYCIVWSANDNNNNNNSNNNDNIIIILIKVIIIIMTDTVC